jgi:hypothetical protein
MFLLWKASFNFKRPTSTQYGNRFEHVNAYCRGTLAKTNFMNAVDTGWVTDEDPEV